MSASAYSRSMPGFMLLNCGSAFIIQCYNILKQHYVKCIKMFFDFGRRNIVYAISYESGLSSFSLYIMPSLGLTAA